MATALNVRVPEALAAESADIVPSELRLRQRGIAEITEMIHVSNYTINSSRPLKARFSILQLFNALVLICRLQASCTMMSWMMRIQGVVLVL